MSHSIVYSEHRAHSHAPNRRRNEEIAIIKYWLEICTTRHEEPNCNTRSSTARPERLIDLSPLTGRPRLITTESLDPVPEFVALSYCWGTVSKNVQTLRSTLAQMSEAIPYGTLPLTVKQAFDLVRAIGFRYLWVDALCIIQDDLADWHREADKMGSVYANASLVIAAMASRGTEEGLYPKVHDPSLVDDTFHLVMRACRTMPRKHWEDTIAATLPLLCRGWGFQERLLARRIVHFTAAELVWECRGDVSCECGQIRNFGAAGRKINNMNAAFNFCTRDPAPERVRPMWRECVKSFSRRTLTFPDDRNYAVRGIAKLLRGEEGVDLYVAGLWRDALPFDLLWRCDQSTGLGERKATRGPSWSWVSVDCGINWPARSEGTWGDALKFISAETYFEDRLEGAECEYIEEEMLDSEGKKVAAQALRVKSAMVEITIKTSPGANADAVNSVFHTEWQVTGPSGATLPFYPDVVLTEQEKCFYLGIIIQRGSLSAWQAGLVVREHGVLVGETGRLYERVGVAGQMVISDECPAASFVPEGTPAKRVVLV